MFHRDRGPMTEMSADKLARVNVLLSSLPGDMAERMCTAAAKGDPALGRLLTYCRLGAEESARRRFFEPLDPVSGDPGAHRPSRAYAPAALQQTIWSWLDEIAPDVTAAAREAASDFDTDAPGRLDGMRVRAAEVMVEQIHGLKDNPKAAKKLRARLEMTDFEPIENVASLLRAAPVTRAALDGLPAYIGEFTDELSASVRDRYETACDRDPDAAVWVLFLVMARMDRPWRLLRVFERIARREDDLLLSRTDMAEIGEALLLDAEHHLDGFAAAPQTVAEAEAAAGALADFAAVTVGMTREIGIRKDGAWGAKLFELRQRASENMTRLHRAALDAFKRATPEEGGLKRPVGPAPKSGEPGHERACALGRFLIITRDDSSRAAVGNAHQATLEEINERLERFADKLLYSIRSGTGDQVETLSARLEDVAGLMRETGAGEAAEIFLRRVAAARAA